MTYREKTRSAIRSLRKNSFSHQLICSKIGWLSGWARVPLRPNNCFRLSRAFRGKFLAKDSMFVESHCGYQKRWFTVDNSRAVQFSFGAHHECRSDTRRLLFMFPIQCGDT